MWICGICLSICKWLENTYRLEFLFWNCSINSHKIFFSTSSHYLIPSYYLYCQLERLPYKTIFPAFLSISSHINHQSFGYSVSALHCSVPVCHPKKHNKRIADFTPKKKNIVSKILLKKFMFVLTIDFDFDILTK